MKSLSRALAAASLAALLAVSPTLGQGLTAGTWSGTIAPPDDPVFDVEYEVSYDEEGALQMAVLPPPASGAPPRIPFQDVVLEDGTLTFSWNAGVTLNCELLLQEDGSFEGECVDASGVPGILTMVPPEG